MSSNEPAQGQPTPEPGDHPEPSDAHPQPTDALTPGEMGRPTQLSLLSAPELRRATEAVEHRLQMGQPVAHVGADGQNRAH